MGPPKNDLFFEWSFFRAPINGKKYMFNWFFPPYKLSPFITGFWAPPCDSAFSLQPVETVGKMPIPDCGNFYSLPDIEMRNEKKGPKRLFRGVVGDEILPSCVGIVS